MSDGPRQSCTWRTSRTHDELSPLPWDRPSASWWQRSVTVARPRVAPALGRTAGQELSPAHPGSRSGRRPSHGDGGRPRGAQPNASKNLSASQAEPAPGRGTLLEQHWSMLSPQLPGSCGQQRQERTEDVGCNRRWLHLQLHLQLPDSGGRDRGVGVQTSTRLPRASRLLAARRWVTEDGPHPPNELGARHRHVRTIVVLVGRATHLP
jgi:hypothetical protein